MKVLMVVSWYSPKDAEAMFAGVFHYEQSMALKSLCETALYFPYDTSLKTKYSKEVENGLLTYRRRHNPLPIPRICDYVTRLEILSHLRKICKDYQPDVLHAHCGAAVGQYVVDFGKQYHYPVVVTEHSPMEQMPLHKPRFKKRLRRTYLQSDANICVSHDSMERLQVHFPECQYRVIYNGILSPEKVRKDGRQYAQAGKINCCIVAGFYSKEIKGYQYLLPAIAQLKAQGVDILLHICGGGDYFDYYQNMARELGISDNCIFYGNCPKEKVYSIVSQMDFNISASIFECSGVSVEEALLLGKPMVVTRSGGANSLVTEDTAIVVDRESVDALVDGILEMIDRLDTFDRDVIYQYAFQNFEIGEVSKQYMQLYSQLLEKRK